MESELGADKGEMVAIRSYIEHGVTIPLVSQPAPLFYNNTNAVNENPLAVRSRLRDYIAFGAVEALPSNEQPIHGIQPLHAVVKPASKPRLVVDLSRNLNPYLHMESFQYASIDDAVALSSPGCWYGKLDLSNAFLSFPLHPAAIPYFTFSFDGKLYRFTRMPFGLATAPLVCTQLLSVVVHALRRRLRRVIAYLDDFLLICDSAEELSLALEFAHGVFTSFGLVVNPSKTEGPTQIITFLGVELNSVTCSTACPSSRLQELESIIDSSLPLHVIRRKQLESLIGKFSFAAQCLPGARPFMRRLLDVLQRCRRRNRAAIVRTDPGFKADLRYWRNHLDSWNGSARWRSSLSTPIVVASDASLQGFGLHLVSVPADIDSSSWPVRLQLGAGISGSWSKDHSLLCRDHRLITACELFAVFAAAWSYRHQLKDRSVLFLVDNSTDVSIINRQSTRSPLLACILRALFDLANKFNFSLRAVHLPGVDNFVADFLSRHSLHKFNHREEWNSLFPAHSSSLLSVSCVDSHQFTVPGLKSLLQ
jgi:hypothetical protein